MWVGKISRHARVQMWIKYFPPGTGLVRIQQSKTWLGECLQFVIHWKGVFHLPLSEYQQLFFTKTNIINLLTLVVCLNLQSDGPRRQLVTSSCPHFLALSKFDHFQRWFKQHDLYNLSRFFFCPKVLFESFLILSINLSLFIRRFVPTLNFPKLSNFDLRIFSRVSWKHSLRLNGCLLFLQETNDLTQYWEFSKILNFQHWKFLESFLKALSNSRLCREHKWDHQSRIEIISTNDIYSIYWNAV